MSRVFNSWIFLLSISILFLCCIVIVAIVTSQWVLFALGVGFLFGFALQKGDLCGSSAMSEVILMRDSRKLFGLWVAILSSMVLFASFESLGVIQLAPKRLIWLSALVGGIIFGVGTVLAGGCISGCMYKAATGNINLVAALFTIPIGISLVDYGPLQSFNKYLLTFVVNDSSGKPITLHSLLGVQYGILVIFFLLLTIVLVLIKQKMNRKAQRINAKNFSVKQIFTASWKPWQAGIVIGVVAILGWLSSLMVGRNYPLGVTHGLSYTYQAIIENNVEFVVQSAKDKFHISKSPTNLEPIGKIQSGESLKPVATKQESRKLNVWLILFFWGTMAGAYVSGKMSDKVKLLPKEPSQTLIAMFGGLLVGIGAGIATGCVIGNILSGWAMFSVGMIIFGIATLLANWATAYFYLMGGMTLKKKIER